MKMITLTADEVISEVTKALPKSDGEVIARIASEVFDIPIKYLENGTFEKPLPTKKDKHGKDIEIGMKVKVPDLDFGNHGNRESFVGKVVDVWPEKATVIVEDEDEESFLAEANEVEIQ